MGIERKIIVCLKRASFSEYLNPRLIDIRSVIAKYKYIILLHVKLYFPILRENRPNCFIKSGIIYSDKSKIERAPPIRRRGIIFIKEIIWRIIDIIPRIIIIIPAGGKIVATTTPIREIIRPTIISLKIPSEII